MRLSNCFAAISLSVVTAALLAAQPSTQPNNDGTQEFGISVGELSSGTPNVAGGALNLDAGIAVQANFARKVRDLHVGALYWEINGLVGPLRDLSGAPATATHQIRSFYLTPGVKLQFTPKEPISPWLVVGGGYALYNSSGTSIANGPVTGGGTEHTYAVDFGGGVDYAFGKRYVVRAEARGFYTGNPNFGTPSTSGLFNFVISGGLVWRSK